MKQITVRSNAASSIHGDGGAGILASSRLNGRTTLRAAGHEGHVMPPASKPPAAKPGKGKPAAPPTPPGAKPKEKMSSGRFANATREIR
jgi:hypothetical protein